MTPHRGLRPAVRHLLTLVCAALVCAVAACTSDSPAGSDGPDASGGADESARTLTTAVSAQDAGGMDALIAAAEQEGELNVIALPSDWVNYGKIIQAFEATYDIDINSTRPEGSSQDEIDAVQQAAPGEGPDVLDLGLAFASAHTELFAPYQVGTWGEIPEAQKESSGLWVQGYGGFMAIGYDSAAVSAPASVADLLQPAYEGKVAITGDPTQSNSALNAVMMASIASGGSTDDISPGIDFFQQLRQMGNFVPVQASPGTIRDGSTPVVFDWDYLSLASVKDVPGWKVFVPPNAVLGGYYAQAINKNAPHPAAARLWQEFLFSDAGQNLWLAGGARPVRLTAMSRAGTADLAALAKLPAVNGAPQFLDADQSMKAAEVLSNEWARAIS